MLKRLRVTFAKDDELKYISHLDLIRTWERLMRRAGVPLAYSKGFNPHPRLAIAAPLPVGVCGLAELMDVFIEGELAPEQFRTAVEPQLPLGLRVVDVAEVPLEEGALQARVSYAEYRIDLAPSLAPQIIETRVAEFLSAAQVERLRRRKGDKAKGTGQAPASGKPTPTYDLRPLVDDLWLEYASLNGGQILRLMMRLRIGPGAAPEDQQPQASRSAGVETERGAGGVGRPDEVLDELELTQFATRICRLKLIVAEERVK